MCDGGILWDVCNYQPEGGDLCDNPWCMQIGHCECGCHSNKTCSCGYKWPRMEKKAK